MIISYLISAGKGRICHGYWDLEIVNEGRRFTHMQVLIVSVLCMRGVELSSKFGVLGGALTEQSPLIIIFIYWLG